MVWLFRNAEVSMFCLYQKQYEMIAKTDIQPENEIVHAHVLQVDAFLEKNDPELNLAMSDFIDKEG